MPEPLLIMLYSGVVTAILFALFSFEAKRKQRFAGRFRTWLDEGVETAEEKIFIGLRFLERDILRLSAHYIFHIVLASCLSVVRILEKLLHNVLHFNRQQAKRSTSSNNQRTIFDEIREHQTSVAMTETQKRKHKEKVLSGK